MNALAWMTLIVTTLAGLGIGTAFGFFQWWRTACRERDTFIELYGLASRDLRALLDGAPVHIVNVCRECNMRIKP